MLSPRAASMAITLVAALTAPSAVAVDVPGVPGRWSISGYGEGLEVLRTDRATEQQHPEGILNVALTGDVHQNLRFFLETRTLLGGTPRHASGGLYNLSDTFQNLSPSVEVTEGYADLHLPRLDVRVGKQRFAWGGLDFSPPTDVINPRAWSDPFMTQEHDAKIGVPALRASYYPDHVPEQLATEASLTVVWVAVPIPFRFPLPGERWFPSTIVPRGLVIPRNAVGRGLPPFRITVAPRLRAANRPPPQQLDEGAVALRANGVHKPVDWSLVYYDGPETMPAFDFSTTAFAPDPTNLARLASVQVVRPRFGRIQLVGAGASTALGGFTVRAEAAYGRDRLLPRRVEDLTTFENILRAVGGASGAARVFGRLGRGRRVHLDLGDLFVARDSVMWGVGADYRWRGWMPLIQVNQTLILDNRIPLLIDDRDTALLANLRRAFLAERLMVEVACIQGLVRSYTALIPAVTYNVTDDLRVKIGFLMLAGTRRSPIGQYHDNDETFAQLRYSF